MIPKGFEGYLDIAMDQFIYSDRSTTKSPDLAEIKSFNIGGDIGNVKGDSLLIGSIQYYSIETETTSSDVSSEQETKSENSSTVYNNESVSKTGVKLPLAFGFLAVSAMLVLGVTLIISKKKFHI